MNWHADSAQSQGGALHADAGMCRFLTLAGMHLLCSRVPRPPRMIPKKTPTPEAARARMVILSSNSRDFEEENERAGATIGDEVGRSADER